MKKYASIGFILFIWLQPLNASEKFDEWIEIFEKEKWALIQSKNIEGCYLVFFKDEEGLLVFVKHPPGLKNGYEKVPKGLGVLLSKKAPAKIRKRLKRKKLDTLIRYHIVRKGFEGVIEYPFSLSGKDKKEIIFKIEWPHLNIKI